LTELDHTHDIVATSWLASANRHDDFPLQNLPFSSFRRRGSGEDFRGGVAIGDQIVDLAALHDLGLLRGLASLAARAASAADLNAFLEMGRPASRALRHALFEVLRSEADESTRRSVSLCLVPQAEAKYQLPTRIGDCADFYTSLDPATGTSKLFRPDEPPAPNSRSVPLQCHGLVSSIGASEQNVPRPMGQILPHGTAEPVFGSSERLDYKLGLGVYIGQGNPQGEPIDPSEVENHVFGLCLLNYWSAQEIQRWESTPLGPLLVKNFATTVSPWIITLEALAPFRLPWARAAAEPSPLPNLDSHEARGLGAVDIHLEVRLESTRHRVEGSTGQRLSATSLRHQYWAFAQMVAHHTVGGCNLSAGDLIGTGTASSPVAAEAGALIELSEDGDAITLKGWCEEHGYARVGFGQSRSTFAAARSVRR
jgi:fumarylacetoacetase